MWRGISKVFRTSIALLGLSLCATGFAQESKPKIDDLIGRLEVAIKESPQPWPLAWPGSSALAPTAYGGTRGVVGFGFGFQPRVRYRNGRSDGSFGVVVPVGDPQKSIGIDLIGNLTNLDDFVDRGTFDVFVHKQFGDSAVAFGTERLAAWGDSDSDRTYFVVGSHLLKLKESNLDPFSRLVVSLGFGDGRFRREADVFRDKKTIGVFGSASINLAQNLNLFTEWTGQDLDVGFSFAPITSIPLVINASAVDLTGSAGDGVRAVFGIGYVLRFH